jgi:hypothetical protein
VGRIRVVFLRANIADNHGVTDLLLLVGWDVMVVDKEEGISFCDLLRAWSWTNSNALAEATKLVGVQGIPLCLIVRIATKLAMFEKLTSSRVQDRQGSRTINLLLKCCAEVCKAVDFLEGHCEDLAESCKAKRLR